MQEITRYEAVDGTPVALSPETVVRDLLPSGDQLSDREMRRFIATCQARRLNPLAGDCYLMAIKGRAQVTVSKEYYMRVAAAQPGFDGFRAGVVVATKDGLAYREGSIAGSKTEKLVGGWAEVYDKGRDHPVRAEVSLEEYDQQQSLWLTKPATMIRKVALVQALREAYPNALGGTYTPDEMPAPDVAGEHDKEQAEYAADAEAEAEAEYEMGD